jgi:hypothetical protein
MKRTIQEGDKVQYRKIYGGSLTFNGKRIKQNQTFWAFPYEIPTAFHDTVVRVDGIVVPEGKEFEKVEPKPAEFTVKQRGTSSWYDVLDAKENRMNGEKALRRTEALALIDELK